MSLRITGEHFLYMVLFYLPNLLLPALINCLFAKPLRLATLSFMCTGVICILRNKELTITCTHNPPDNFFKETIAQFKHNYW